MKYPRCIQTICWFILNLTSWTWSHDKYVIISVFAACVSLCVCLSAFLYVFLCSDNFPVCVFKIQDLAIRCIQKNINKNRGVKDWPWWKLFTTVQPLIKVQLTEDQMRSKDVSRPFSVVHRAL